MEYNKEMLAQLVHTHYFYICILVFSIAGLVLADWRYKLAFWHDKVASTKAIGFTMLLLLIFDIAGVVNNIFYTNQDYVVRLNVFSPNLPVEEILFLFMLCYVTLILYRIIGKVEILKRVRDDGPGKKRRL